MCRWAVCSISCIRTSESGTLLPFSFSRSSRATLSAVSAVHSLVKASKTTLKHQNSLKSLFELQHESTPASLSCLRGYYSNMAPRTIKRAIRIVVRSWQLCRDILPSKRDACTWRGVLAHVSVVSCSAFTQRRSTLASCLTVRCSFYPSLLTVVHYISIRSVKWIRFLSNGSISTFFKTVVLLWKPWPVVDLKISVSQTTVSLS